MLPAGDADFCNIATVTGFPPFEMRLLAINTFKCAIWSHYFMNTAPTAWITPAHAHTHIHTQRYTQRRMQCSLKPLFTPCLWVILWRRKPGMSQKMFHKLNSTSEDCMNDSQWLSAIWYKKITAQMSLKLLSGHLWTIKTTEQTHTLSNVALFCFLACVTTSDDDSSV